jgi:hypothetical protein
MRHTVLLGAFALTLGCGKGGSITGSIAGKSLSVEDAIFGTLAADGDYPSPAQNIVAVALTSVPDACGDIRANISRKDASYLLLFMRAQDDLKQRVDVQEGPYFVSGAAEFQTSLIAAARFVTYDAVCNDAVGDPNKTTAVSGSIDLIGYDAKSSAEGDFSLDMGTQRDHIGGRFHAGYCDAFDALLASRSQPQQTCE